MDEIDYSEAYIRIDADDDGVAELRKIITAGDKIPEGEEWNEVIDSIPITGGVIKRMPHTHIGESINDEIDDLSEVKTVLNRQMLDNIYATNNQQWIINERVNQTDFLESLPGGVKRVSGELPVTGCYEAVQTTPILAQVLPALDHVDKSVSNRTGVNNLNTDVDPDILKETTEGALTQGVKNASGKMENYIRMFGETLVKPMSQQVHGIIRKHQDVERITRLRGKFVKVNPREWKERTDMRLRVGLGTGTDDEKRRELGFLAQQQEMLKPLGLVGPKQAYNMFTEMAETVGKDKERKSTRLNSSHQIISYAAFCLKTKRKGVTDDQGSTECETATQP